MKEKNHSTVSIFVPHEGCPQQCAFCNQRYISGAQKPPTPEQVVDIVDRAAKNLRGPAQIAFFGGSFTALNRVYMVSLLQCVQKHLNELEFSGIRISTRPDFIDKDILDILKYYHVTDIEIGIQNMSDPVLQANLRGHGSNESVIAASHIKNYGFGLGLQMMTGMYGSDTDNTLDTAKRIIGLNPDSVRIYPTMVLRDTLLERLFEQGKYKPQTLDEAVGICAELLSLFTDNGIPVIRMGLHDSPGLKDSIIAGPHHPAFGELCESRVLMSKILDQIRQRHIPVGEIFLLTEPASISKMVGHKRENILKLEKMGYKAKVIPDGRVDYLQAEVLQRM